MIYRKVDCPHCGNEISVKSVPESQKCQFCRRPVKATFTKGRGKKWRVDVEPVDFPEEQKFNYGKKSFNDSKGDRFHDARRH